MEKALISEVCRDIRIKVAEDKELLYGGGKPDENAIVRGHINNCPSCAHIFRSFLKGEISLVVCLVK